MGGRGKRRWETVALLVLTCVGLVFLAAGSAQRAVASRTSQAAGRSQYQRFLPVISIPSLQGSVAIPAGGSGTTGTSSPIPSAITLGTGSRLGIWLGPAGNDQMINLTKQAGAQWTRFHLEWSAIQPTGEDPAVYDFSAYDGDLAAAGKAGLTAIVEVRSNPSWAADTRCGAISQKDQYAAFIAALVNHYKISPYNVKHWEFFNEPDNRHVLNDAFVGGCFGDTPEAYVDTLQVAYNAVKAADPEAKVVLGGLAFDQWNDPTFGPVFNLNFFDQILSLGAASYFDIANLHYYSSQAGEWSAYGKDVTGKITAFRQVMARWNVSKPVVVTETNWTGGPSTSTDLLEQQARYVPKVLARGLANDLYAVYWFMLKEWPGADYPYGLVDLDLNPRPAYRAYQTAQAEFGAATSVRPLAPSEVGLTGGVEGYAFNVQGQERWVLWSDGAKVTANLPSRPYELRNNYGQSIYRVSSTSPTSITLDDTPVYLIFTR